MNKKLHKAMTTRGIGTGSEILLSVMRGLISETAVVKIGIITSFDSVAQTVNVRPAIKRVDEKDTSREVTVTSASYPDIVKVPVMFPGGGDWAITFPVAPGDECILLFNDDSINNWKKYGGEQDPSHFTRHHSMKDAIAIVGLHSPGQALPDFNKEDMEIRKTDGSTKFTIKDGEVNFNGDIVVTGGDVVADGISLKTHVHPPGTYQVVTTTASGTWPVTLQSGQPT